MTKSILAISLGSLALLVSCASQPPVEISMVETPASGLAETTVVTGPATPAGLLPTVVAAAAATPATTATQQPLAPPAVRTSPTAVPTAGPPTATPTLAPSASLTREAMALQEELETFRDAIAIADKDALLKAQRALLERLGAAESAAAGDQSKAAEAFRSGLRDLRAALGGDLPKLDSAMKGIAQVTSGSVSRQTPAADGQVSVQPIQSLPKFAKDLADRIAAFRKAQDEGNVTNLLRLQKGLLEDVERGQGLKSSRSKDAEIVRGALEDLANALAGDNVKFEAAELKLRQVGGAVTVDVSKPATGSTKTVDLKPVANELMNKLNAYQHALEGNSKGEIATAAKALSDQVSKAQEALKSDQSPRAARLREVLGTVREVAAGDQTKVEAAKNAIEQVMSR